MRAFSQLLKSFGNMKVSVDAMETCYAAVSRQYVVHSVWTGQAVWAFTAPVAVYRVSTALTLQQVLL
jgi:hypothetical protein